MRAVNLASLSTGCSWWPGWSFEAVLHWRPLLWCFYARRDILHVLALSFAIEIIMHSSILCEGPCACVTCFMCCFTLSDNWGTHHVLLRGKKKNKPANKSLISARIIMAERQSQFCYSFVSQDSEEVLGRNRESAEGVFLWLLRSRDRRNWVDLCKYTELEQEEKRAIEPEEQSWHKKSRGWSTLQLVWSSGPLRKHVC